MSWESIWERGEWFFIGLAGLLEVVLFLVLSQPINRSRVPVWLRNLVGGAVLYHLAYFARLLIAHEESDWVTIVDRAAMAFLSCGLLLMPAAMLHGSLRLAFTGIDQLQPTRDRRYLLVYVPCVLLLPALGLIWNGQQRDFMQTIGPIRGVYAAWLLVANLASIVGFGVVAFRIFKTKPTQAKFFLWLIGILVLLTAGAVFYSMLDSSSRWERACRIALGVAPLLPSSIFVWYTLRRRLIPFVYDESIVYGGLVLTGLLLHRLIVTPLTIRWRETWNIDFIVLEVMTIVALVWFVKPLRLRASESLRFLLSTNAFAFRDALRSLTLDVTRQTGEPLATRCEWFQIQLKERFRFAWVVVQVDGLHSKVLPNGEMLHKVQSAVQRSLKPVERGEEDDEAVGQAMDELQCEVALPIHSKSLSGVVAIGGRAGFGRLANEQVTSLLVLVEQFAATLQNQFDEELRRQAERKSLHQEKLSTLGLVSGSLAHELRNPLSSIRTIASLVGEETTQATHQHDLKLIVSEVDRLNQTLQRMLDFAKPSDDKSLSLQPDRVIARLVSMMEYLAQQHQVKLELHLGAEAVWIQTSEAALNEIFMNLIKNGIEASSERGNGTVVVLSHSNEREYTVSIQDNGCGIEPHRLESIFLPFETGKETGTGLGLYIVSERIHELGGKVAVESKLGTGTTFEVVLPLERRP